MNLEMMGTPKLTKRQQQKQIKDKAGKPDSVSGYPLNLPSINYSLILKPLLNNSMATEDVKLLGTWSSPFVLRVNWALKMKGVEYEFIHEDLSNKSPMLLKYNPVNKKVPVLIHNDKSISESLVIIEYIDETWKHNPILPKDPHARAMARFWSKFGDDKCLQSIWNVFISRGKERDEALVTATENLKFLEEELKGKKFFGGEMVGLADIALGCIAAMTGVLEEIMELKIIDEENFPSLSAWSENFTNFPAIKGSYPPRDKMLLKYRAIREAIFASQGNM